MGDWVRGRIDGLLAGWMESLTVWGRFLDAFVKHYVLVRIHQGNRVKANRRSTLLELRNVRTKYEHCIMYRSKVTGWIRSNVLRQTYTQTDKYYSVFSLCKYDSGFVSVLSLTGWYFPWSNFSLFCVYVKYINVVFQNLDFHFVSLQTNHFGHTFNWKEQFIA